ncbi:hypothetical protein [Mucilaginibacter ginsenosidivorax]|uniref:Tail fiber protein n=1 Tax=Mucilaginibacter ginsenosidivorax TaxID=862126 RepID=A0A5B8VXC4_9SPHI|nr:hypothetical protein [Mucilaginibacter ginsenosidivorax]QEC75861.1 hypothetical protein FSB76_07840 [Mucilaginibacter ginsenosidivorax]
MKILKNPLLYLGILLIVTIVAFTNKETQATQPWGVGDVVYSILDSDLFAKTHTGKWVLLDGKPLDKNTQLYKLLDTHNVINVLQVVDGYTILPDARGVFIRGINNKRPSLTGDPDGERIVGRYQNDIVGPHSHGWTGEAGYMGGYGYPDNAERRWTEEGLKKDPKFEKDRYVASAQKDYSISGVGGETRPKNIALYTYIKVSE